MIGADISMIVSPYGKMPVVHNAFMMQCIFNRNPFFNIKPTLPAAVAGTTQQNAPEVISDLGYDCCLGAGGAVHGHPMGPTAGARAMRQAIDAVMAGVDLEEYAKDHAELAGALKMWGNPKDNFDLVK